MSTDEQQSGAWGQSSFQPEPKPRPSHLWKPGQSGNPKGCPPRVAEAQKLAREYTEEAVRTLANLMANAGDERLRAWCADKLLDRAWGKPKETMELVEDVASGKVRKLTIEERIALLKAKADGETAQVVIDCSRSNSSSVAEIEVETKPATQ